MQARQFQRFVLTSQYGLESPGEKGTLNKIPLPSRQATVSHSRFAYRWQPHTNWVSTVLRCAVDSFVCFEWSQLAWVAMETVVQSLVPCLLYLARLHTTKTLLSVIAHSCRRWFCFFVVHPLWSAICDAAFGHQALFHLRLRLWTLFGSSSLRSTAYPGCPSAVKGAPAPHFIHPSCRGGLPKGLATAIPNSFLGARGERWVLGVDQRSRPSSCSCRVYKGITSPQTARAP